MKFYETDSLYYIFHQIIKLHFKRTFECLEHIGIYPGQPPMLGSLYKNDGQSQKELANKLSIKPATITVMINRMEKMELLERRQDIKDQRVSRVFLTEKGKKIWEKTSKVMEEINLECFDNFTEEEKILLRRLLMQVRENLIQACNEKTI